jgi:SAM-dependent methyltransferase
MNIAVLDFFLRNVDCEEFNGKRVLEVGSKFVNGSVRPLIERFCKPKEYIGIDIEPGKYVDIVLPVEKLLNVFGAESFNVVISTETLEHVLDWRTAVNNMKLVLKRGGYIYITTRSRGFPYHGYPYDYWRFETGDLIKIFRDFEIIRLERDWEAPGVFLKARKPINWRPIDLNDVALHSILLGKRVSVRELTSTKIPYLRRIGIIICNSRIKWLLPGVLLYRIIKKKLCT